MKLAHVGKLLARARKSLGWSLRQAASEVPGSITYERIRRVEEGEGTLEDAVRLIHFYTGRAPLRNAYELAGWAHDLSRDVLDFMETLK